MSSKLSNDTVGKKLVDFYNPILGEVRDTFKNNSYEEIQRAYNLSDKEINGYVEKYLSKIKNYRFSYCNSYNINPYFKNRNIYREISSSYF